MRFSTSDFVYLDKICSFARTQPLRIHLSYAPMAQLDRATGYEPVGRAFESLWVHFWRDARVAEGARLLSECVGNSAPRVRIPLSPPYLAKKRVKTI